jgi:CBS domain-containing protein
MPSRLIREVIKHQKIVTLPPTGSVRAASQAMEGARVGSVLVVEGGKLAGIFTERDALFRVLAKGLDPDATPLANVMTAGVTTVNPGQRLVHALHLMHDNGFRHLPVVEHGKPVGIVSIRDALGSELVHFEREASHKAALEQILG